MPAWTDDETLAALVDHSAAPPTVRVALERLDDAHPGLADRLVTDEPLARAVVAVVAASRDLTVLLETDAEALDVLHHLERPAGPPGADGSDPAVVDVGELRRCKAHEYLRIAARDLLGLDDLPTTTAAIAQLAADVLAVALRLSGADDLVVVGMGKLGGRELNYASDIDVLFVGTDEGAAREVVRIAGRCFRVDANLRPEGRDGPLVRTVDSYVAYWERWARPWEFQALLKARPVAGPGDLAQAFAAAAAEHVWERPLPADELRSLRSMKARVEADVARRGGEARELKRGAGGIRDIEFAVQLLQLVHGRHDPALRSPSTLHALDELGAAGYVDVDDAAALDRSYRFLRTVEHRVQLVDGQQLHAVPAGDADRDRLARVLGFRSTPELPALAAFDAALASCRSEVRAIHERLYFRPLLEAFSGAPGRLSPDAAATRLAAFGFADVERTRQAVAELTRGLTRSSRLMQQLLPLLLGWLSDSPDPDGGLLGLRKLASGPQRSAELAQAFRESTEGARRLCCLLGTSKLLGELLEHNPDLIGDLADDESLAPRSRTALAGEATKALGWRAPDNRQPGLQRLKDRELLRVAARDVLGLAGVDGTAADLTQLAEVTVATALAELSPTLPFTVIAMGRFGGGELSYASDLDLLFVYDGAGAGDAEEAERLASAMVRFIGGATPAERLYEVDASLRPEGRQGPLARSLDGFEAYFERWAAVWERQAMVRARPFAGDAELGERFLARMAPFLWERPLGADGEREIRRIKARVERERIPAGEDPQFHLKLGPGSLSDVEFTVQLLQLRHGVAAQGTMTALAHLAAGRHVGPDDTEVLAEAYRFCERTRNRLYLVRGVAGDALPRRAEEMTRLARSLDTSPVELRESYRRVTRRCRAVVERLFYGRMSEPGTADPGSATMRP